MNAPLLLLLSLLLLLFNYYYLYMLVFYPHDYPSKVPVTDNTCMIILTVTKKLTL